MDDKVNYSLLMNNISDIKNDMILLNSMHDELSALIKETLLIDNEIVEKDSLNELKISTNNIIRQLSEEVIPIISNKL